MIRRVPHDVRPIASAALIASFAVGIFGISFGVVAVTSGATVLQACVMSLLVFTGASQFSAMSVIGAGGSPLSAFGGAAILAGRNFVYGLTMAPTLTGSLGKRLFSAQFVIDETTAIATAQSDPRLRRAGFWWTAIALYSFWNLGTLIGALVGTSIDPKTFGLDSSFAVLFTAMIVPHLRTRQGRRAAAFGAVSAVALAPFVPIGLPVLVAAFGMLFGLSPDSDRSSKDER